jgi:hypothetical protein
MRHRVEKCNAFVARFVVRLESSTVHDPIDTNITWLLQNIGERFATFSIDRSREECHTPRRNPSIDAAVQFAHKVMPPLRALYHTRLFADACCSCLRGVAT